MPADSPINNPNPSLSQWLKWLDRLACPACHGTLCAEADAIVCTACARRYPILNGIPVLIPVLIPDRATASNS